MPRMSRRIAVSAMTRARIAGSRIIIACRRIMSSIEADVSFAIAPIESRAPCPIAA